MKRLRKVLMIGVVTIMFSAGGYGLVRFPDSPIHKCGAEANYLYRVHPYGYCGKQGQSRTAADYASFERWQNTMFVIWPVGLLALAVLQILTRRFP